MRAALAHCRPHQSKFEGMEWVYSDVAMRWTKWMVRAKSGMSFERETRRRRNITLQSVRELGISYGGETHRIAFRLNDNPNTLV